MNRTQSSDRFALDADLGRLCQLPFRDAPPACKRAVYGVPYVELSDSSGGTLWLTVHGWNFLEQLSPERWYRDRRYVRQGEHLSQGSGAVFRIASQDSRGRVVNLVVKFSRMAQDLPLQVSSRFPSGLPRHVLDDSAFHDPFGEFGALEELRRGEFGDHEIPIRTKRPLAIYSPGRQFAAWQLRRSEHQFQQYVRRLAEDQKRLPQGVPPVKIHFDRQYITLFQWVRGQDAESLVKAGVIDPSCASELVMQASHDLKSKGFRMLDVKPNHIILRQRRDGSLLTRQGRFVYALVDFELLQRTEEYRQWREMHAISAE